MKLIKQSILPDGTGSVTLYPEEPEDMWHAYNLIAPTDLLKASAVRRVTTESATGSTNSKRIRTTLLIQVTSIDFDSFAGQLHVSGRVASENEWVSVGAYHTLDLELERQFTLEKPSGWDSVALDVVKESLRELSEGTIPAVVMQAGLANICLITEHQTVLKQTVEVPIPGKRGGESAVHDKALEKFYKTTLETLQRHVDISQPGRMLLLASPGFIASGFQKFIFEEAKRTGNKALLANKGNISVVHSSSGHLHSLNQVLKSKEVLVKLKDTKYAKETKAMDEFFDRLRADDGRAWYGPSEVEKAVAQGAVGRGGGVLLILNSMFRSQDVDTRKRWVTLVDKVRGEDGGLVLVLSSDHESGKRLEVLGGIAAILTYPIEDLDEDVPESTGGEGGESII
ncbi:protein DOM34 [Coleophoma cylindrospora]|uniref:Protein DOM34 homolog n=1 Tax=Coleophoma cylindrospora TaxID=1849047 RepID=A0A3D8RMJ9_9HELO|nr:protein DOM34 [Coleophoma cylindrospora]